MTRRERELALFRTAQATVDTIMGSGTYERLNHFSPARGETRPLLLRQFDRVCPGCGGEKSPGAVKCRSCRAKLRRPKP